MWTIYHLPFAQNTTLFIGFMLLLQSSPKHTDSSHFILHSASLLTPWLYCTQADSQFSAVQKKQTALMLFYKQVQDLPSRCVSVPSSSSKTFELTHSILHTNPSTCKLACRLRTPGYKAHGVEGKQQPSASHGSPAVQRDPITQHSRVPAEFIHPRLLTVPTSLPEVVINSHGSNAT